MATFSMLRGSALTHRGSALGNRRYRRAETDPIHQHAHATEESLRDLPGWDRTRERVVGGCGTRRAHHGREGLLLRTIHVENRTYHLVAQEQRRTPDANGEDMARWVVLAFEGGSDPTLWAK